jgi:DNA-binding transcriptional regulator YdaS (Cro superfamily)
MTTPALDRACEILGSQDALAMALGIRSASISGWRDRGRIPVERCVPIEVATKGAVRREELRPDIFGPVPEAPAADQAAA